MSGRVLGFGGRILTNEKKTAKYLNSPESDIYHKSKVLYGINFAKQAIAKEDNCYLVEGYTDVIQFHQSGIENVVSSSGTALTPDQIRLINRLTKNITVLFDGDAAGIRASLRGIDLILEQGMNVRVCTFPTGEDPDSFAKNNSDEALSEYLQENAQDFISYKASLLMEEAKKDPVKKAELIRDIVNSISKIPDTIQQEVYLQECSRIMDISENVLFSSLAQLNAKSGRATSQKPQQQKKSFDVVKEDPQPKTTKVDEQYELEKKIISLLLQYGTVVEEFEDLVLKEKEDGELSLEKEVQKTRVFEKIFLDLQEDEIAFANPKFRDIYAELIARLNSEEKFEVKNFINEIDPEQASEITSILMEEEQYKLHEWDRQNIFVKAKTETISRHVSETILSLRRFLINQKINELSEKVKTPVEDQETQHILEDVKDYLSLKKVLSEKLNRVM
jgi:DNA primase